ncbi:MAG: hypothetical protein D4R39_02430 [Methylophilaceae bacterium]|nr:MAG: hypothetical protein D4R39_02430 [Methylophilaceae bacterium]
MNVSSILPHEQMVSLEVGHHGRTLSITLKSEKVDSARFSGTIGDVEKAVMSSVCKAMVGYSLREATEHSAVYAVKALISNGILRRPPGIALPSAMGQELALADILIGKIRQEAWAVGLLAGDGWNFEDRGLSQQWTGKGGKEKVAEIRAQLKKFLLDRGDSADSISISEIDRYDRINVHFSETVPISKKPKMLMDFESYIRDCIGERLEVFVTEMKDMNRIRRL